MKYRVVIKQILTDETIWVMAKHRGLTGTKLARAMNVSPSYISKLKNEEEIASKSFHEKMSDYVKSKFFGDNK